MADGGPPADRGQRATPAKDQPTGIYIALGVIGVVVGIGGLLIYSSTLHKSASVEWQVFGIGLAVSAASATAGGVIGFLFGIPRRREGGGAATGREAGAGRRLSDYLPNTNLEQVSDWLTKILVGIGLVEFGRMGAPAGRLVGVVGKSLGGGDGARVMAGCLMVLFLILGFMVGYLWTATDVMLALKSANADDLAAALSDKVADNERLAKKVAERVTSVVREEAARGSGDQVPDSGHE
ncbi:hypothetical protein [Streptomyces sp. NPDC037389]|uniref:hypothetical protein n=1 Tax=Streptomyces sp. NPDC037389 TaxID=3155369 RepID=UPI0033D5E3ED